METLPTWSCEALDKGLPTMHHDIPTMHILLQICPGSMQINPGSVWISPGSVWILWGDLTVNVERINNLYGSAPAGSVQILGWINSWCKEDQQSTWISPRSVWISPWSTWILRGVNQQSTWRGSTVNFYMDNSRDLAYVYCMLILNLFYNALFQLKAVH